MARKVNCKEISPLEISPLKRPENKSGSVLGSLSNAFNRYWFVAVPAILLNAVIAIDHVVATNNENVHRVALKATAMEAMEALATVRMQDQDPPMSETLQAHWITTNNEGNLEGRISAIDPTQSITIPIEKLSVSLLQKGQKIRKTTTGNDGRFTMEDVEPGVYTLVGAGQSGFLAYGIHVLPKLEQVDQTDRNTQLDQSELKAYYVSHLGVPQDVVVVDELQIDAAAVPPEFSSLQRISQNYLPSSSAFGIVRDLDDVKATEKGAEITGGFKYPLSATGGLEGRIQPIATSDGEPAKLSEMNIFLIQDDIEAARVTVEENGKFAVEGVEPGVYSLIAAGKDGFAAMSLELVPSVDADLQSSLPTKAYYASTRGVAAKPKKLPSLGIAIVTDPDDLQFIRSEATRVFNLRQQMFNQPNDQIASNLLDPAQGFAPQGVMDGGFPSGSGFTGGFPGGSGGGVSGSSFGQPASGGGGGGPLFGGRGNRRGGLIAAIVLGTVGIVAISDDNNSPDNPPDSSPFLN